MHNATRRRSCGDYLLHLFRLYSLQEVYGDLAGECLYNHVGSPSAHRVEHQSPELSGAWCRTTTDESAQDFNIQRFDLDMLYHVAYVTFSHSSDRKHDCINHADFSDEERLVQIHHLPNTQLWNLRIPRRLQQFPRILQNLQITLIAKPPHSL